MWTSRSVLLVLWLGSSWAQKVDDFSCPDEFEGFYPHLISCDKYWHCRNSVADLKTCGNGLAFLDTDPTFTLEQCEELHLVECGPRTDLEAPVATRNCPRLYGTFPDPESCSVFWKCFDGKANRYECPPGLAYDAVSRGCKWADQVPECKNVVVAVEGKEEEFKCPSRGAVGTFTKHAHPSDCRQYFVCIGGTPREYGCPLGTVFSIGSDEFSGKCVDPEEVAECANYYGDLQFDSVALSRAGADTGPQAERVRSGGDHAFRNTLNTVSNDEPIKRPSAEEGKRRPAPPALQAIIDETADTVTQQQPEAPARVSRPRPGRPPVRPASEEPAERPAPIVATEAPATTRPKPSTDSPIRILTERTTEVTDLPTELPATRIQVLTDRPKTTLSRRPPAVASTFPVTATSRPFTAVFSPELPSFTLAPTVATFEQPPATQSAPTVIPGSAVTSADGLPDPAPASPGPNGEEYYYYYYYYDDEEGGEQKPIKQKQPRPAPSA